jgi:dTDP-4-dehydrorhamnose reductase
VGALLYRYCAEKGSCVGTYCNHEQPGLCRLDLRDHRAVRKILQELCPEVCYVPGGLTHVDYAEDYPEECREINVRGIGNLAEILESLGSRMVLFSTDHVFGDSPAALADARGSEGHREDDPVEPLSAYAKSKAHAEQTVREILPKRHLILRTSWVFGPDPQEKNFVYRVRRTLQKGEPLVVPSDQHGQPTFGPDLARTALQLVTRGITGTFHVVGLEYLSRLGWAQMIAKTLELPLDLIEGRPTGALAQSGKRPLHVRLARKKLLDEMGCDPIRSPRQGLEEMSHE